MKTRNRTHLKRISSACISSILIYFLNPLSIQAQASSALKNDEGSPNNIVIHHEINFAATPQEIYQTLLSSKEFSACIKKSFSNFSEKSAAIDGREGGAFSLFDGHIVGRNIELIPNQRIVQAWRVVDWPVGVFSTARFELKPQGNGTLLVFDHVGFPEGLKEHLAEGWRQHYWNTLEKFFK